MRRDLCKKHGCLTPRHVLSEGVPTQEFSISRSPLIHVARWKESKWPTKMELPYPWWLTWFGRLWSHRKTCQNSSSHGFMYCSKLKRFPFWRCGWSTAEGPADVVLFGEGNVSVKTPEVANKRSIVFPGIHIQTFSHFLVNSQPPHSNPYESLKKWTRMPYTWTWHRWFHQTFWAAEVEGQATIFQVVGCR